MFLPQETSSNPDCMLPCKNGFLTKLWDILKDTRNKNVICWSEVNQKKSNF